MAINSDPDNGKGKRGKIPYISATTEHSLYGNGRVLTRRNLDGSDNEGWVGVDLEVWVQPVTDARDMAVAHQPTLNAHGFEVHTQPLATAELDFLNQEDVLRRYYPDCEALVREVSGARLVAAFDHNVRSAAGKSDRRRIVGGQEVQGPARVVHGDYTLTSAPQRLRDLARPPTANDTFRSVLAGDDPLLDADQVEDVLAGGRYAIINVWRNISVEPVATHPLALCDAASVSPEDLVVFEIHYHDRVGENYFSKPATRHNWIYWSALTRHETLLIKQWDSSGNLARTKGARGDTPGPDNPCTFSFHTAFKDSETLSNSPPRWSIEVRCIVLYD